MLQRLTTVFLLRRGEGEDVAEDQALEACLEKIAIALVENTQTSQYKFAPEADQELRAQQAFVAKHRERPDLLPAFGQWLEKSVNEFGRFALIFHFLEHYSSPAWDVAGGPPPALVSIETARRARRYLTDFVYPHALIFYRQVLGSSQNDDRARWVAEHILAHRLQSIQERDVYKNYGPLKDKAKRGEVAPVMRLLEMHDWLVGKTKTNKGTVVWSVNPKAHLMFAALAEKERLRREAARESIAKNGEIRAAARKAPGGNV
jgi:hypothetical protein